ncbi:hypothetical protein [Sphingobium sp. CR28]|uniref:hypothetical protein n=1 Tax=Sphingobium sp. CR28 TaxID=3400272 RepID=UPI003FED4417
MGDGAQIKDFLARKEAVIRRQFNLKQTLENLNASSDHALQNNRVWFFSLFALLILQASLIISHAPWLDEYQAAQIALQSPDFPALLENLRYEGHPPLWYLVLQLVGLAVPPAWVLPAAQLPIALAMQAIILSRPQFTRLERLLIASSVFFFFDYGVLSRSLSLGVLLTVTAFAFHQRRIAWLCIALMPMTDFLFGVISGAWLTIAWIERNRSSAGIIIWLLSGLLAAWTVRPAPDMHPALALGTPLIDALIYLVRLSALLVPLPINEGVLQWNTTLPMPFSLMAGMIFPCFVWGTCRPVKLHGILIAAFVSLTAIFSIAIYPLPIRHLSLICLLMLMLVLKARDNGVREPVSFRLWLWVIASGGLLSAVVSISRPFDTASEAARYIRSKGLVDKHWVVFPDSRAQGISALNGMEFERLERGCTQSFVRWNYRSEIRRFYHLVDVLTDLRDRYGRFYLLSDELYPTSRAPGLLKRVHSVPAGYDGQEYHIYVVGPDRPERTNKPPQCAPRRLPMPPWSATSG